MSQAITQRQYVLIWVWLAALMLLGVLLSTWHLPHRTVVLAVLGLSTVKAVMVAAYYMHLKFDRKFLTFVATLPIPFGILLVVMVLLDKPWVP